ncbi:MAG TPA: tetratricopeptide repeat protein, partial [Candidatus Saccharimonadales bacterium]|nr:tetratricopeptide repeat protein [Candidatus Saccharimonadales bacterium]
GLSSGMQPLADRYSYLPTIGIFLLLGGAFAAAWHRGGARRLLATALGALLVVGLASRTLAETGRWRSSIRLWESVIATAPGSREYVDAYVNLGASYVEAGRIPEARATLERAAAIDSSRADVLYNLGMVQYAGGERERAASSLRRATGANPGDARAFYNLAIVLDELGRGEEAMTAMREAARLGSRDAVEALNASPVLPR